MGISEQSESALGGPGVSPGQHQRACERGFSRSGNTAGSSPEATPRVEGRRGLLGHQTMAPASCGNLHLICAPCKSLDSREVCGKHRASSSAVPRSHRRSRRAARDRRPMPHGTTPPVRLRNRTQREEPGNRLESSLLLRSHRASSARYQLLPTMPVNATASNSLQHPATPRDELPDTSFCQDARPRQHCFGCVELDWRRKG